MAEANAHVSGLKKSDSIGIYVIFSCLHICGSYLICATWEEKIGIGSLEPRNVNAASLQVLNVKTSHRTTC